MLDKNFLDIWYEKGGIRGGSFLLDENQEKQLLEKIHEAILESSRRIDHTTLRTNRTKAFQENEPKLFASLLKKYDGNLSNILLQITPEEFYKMDVDRENFAGFGTRANVVYVYEHKENIGGREITLYIKFVFEDEDKTVILKSCHIPQYPMRRE